MNFSGMFSESSVDTPVSTNREHNGKNNSDQSPKKRKSSYVPVEQTHTGEIQENSTENSGKFLNKDSTTKSDDVTLHQGNPGTIMETALRKLGQDAKMTFLKWIQQFGESEAFEAYCPPRLDEILKQTLELEQNLTEQKECLKSRLKAVSRTLQIA